MGNTGEEPTIKSIEYARQLKFDLRTDILDSILRFQKLSGMHVTGINLTIDWGANQIIMYDVDVKVEL